MNPKKEEAKKAKNAGISLAPDLKTRATDLAKKMGFKSLSALTHKLLSDQLEKAAQAAEQAAQAAKQLGREKKQRGLHKIRAARNKE